jgi:hypothetical protein
MEEYRDVDRRRFREEIRPLGRPAVLRGLADRWPAVEAGRRSPRDLAEYLMRMAVPKRLAALVGAPEIGGRFFYRDDLRSLNFDRINTDLAEFLGRLLQEQEARPPRAIALQSEPIPEILPGFREANDTDLVDTSVVPRAWIGNALRVAPHYDLMENIGVVVAGRRRFTVFPPDQIANLYTGPLELTPAGTPVSLVDLAAPDLDRFPRFAEALAVAQTAELAPGDAIYLPFHWWHGVDSLEPVNLFVNYWWNEARRDLGNPYDALMHGFYALRHMPPEQRAVWRTMFDHYVFCANGDPAEHLPQEARGVLGPATPQLLERMRATLKQIFARM